MKRKISLLFVFGALITFTLYLGAVAKAQEASLEVELGVICGDVVDREPVDVGEEFDASVHKLFCYTKIVGVEEPIEITHVWYWGEVERARIALRVEASGWRTWTSKVIQSHETGGWHVDVLGPGDEPLKTLNFTIKGAPREEPAPGTSELQVDVGVICRDVIDREPVDTGEEFEATVGKLFCYTKIVGIEEPVEITHVWYYGDGERARIALRIEASGWRTWTTKNIMDHEIGQWHVDILGPEGELLKTLNFTVRKELP